MQAIESVLAQTAGDFELIICDNASEDETPEIIQRFEKRDERIRAFRQPTNIGPTANFRSAFDHANPHSPYFMWLSHDDFMKPKHLEICCNVLDGESDVVLAAGECHAVRIDPDDREFIDTGLTTVGFSASEAFRALRELFYTRDFMVGIFYGVMRREALAAMRPLPNVLAADHIFLLELGLRGRFRTVPEITFHKRRGGMGSSRARILKGFGLRNPIALYAPLLLQEILLQRALLETPALRFKEKVVTCAWSLRLYLYRLVRKRIYRALIKLPRRKWLARRQS